MHIKNIVKMNEILMIEVVTTMKKIERKVSEMIVNSSHIQGWTNLERHIRRSTPYFLRLYYLRESKSWDSKR